MFLTANLKKIFLILAFTSAALLITTCGRVGPDAPPDKTPPTIASTSPQYGAQGVPINAGIAVSFNEEMDPKSINSQTISLTRDGSPVYGSLTYSAKTALFKSSSNLAANSVYTLVISIGVKDLAGNAMVAPYFCTFTTGAAPDTAPPAVVGATPDDAPGGVSISSPVTVTFSEAMNASTITTSTFAVSGLAGTVSYDDATRTAAFVPAAALGYGTTYTATITSGINGVKDLAGNALVNNYTWSFKTGPAPDITPPAVSSVFPGNRQNGVPLDITITVTFNEPIDPNSINFTLSGDGISDGPVPCTMTCSGTTAAIKPSRPLVYSAGYTATVSGVKDLAGNMMPSSYSWGFTTAAAPDTTPPGIDTVFPGNGQSSVPLDITITVTFNEPIDQSSINFALSGDRISDGPVPCTMIYSGATATITPSRPLVYSAVYTATVSGVKDLAGNMMPSSYSWGFTTAAAPDATPPGVDTVFPGNGQSSVPLDITITVTFNEPIDPNSINFTLSGDGISDGPVPCTMIYSGTTVTITPSRPLVYDGGYTAMLRGVKDLSGNAMPDYSWSFTTVQAPL